MRKSTVLTALLLAAMFVFSACNAATTTEPEGASAPSTSENASLSHEEYTPDLTLARQVFDQLQAHTFYESKYSYFSNPLSLGAATATHPYKDYFLYDDVNEPVFPSRQTIEQLHPGLFINEVYDLLGAPHFNSCFLPMDAMVFVPTDVFTMYVLDDGNVLLLRYCELYYGKYDWEELSRRIPYEKYYTDERMVGDDSCWKELISVELLSLDELAEKNLSAWEIDGYRTAAEYLPKKISQSTRKQIKVGMTYGQIKERLGSGGYCGIDDNGYTFSWEFSDEKKLLYVHFAPLADGGEYFDDLVAVSVTVK